MVTIEKFQTMLQSLYKQYTAQQPVLYTAEDQIVFNQEPVICSAIQEMLTTFHHKLDFCFTTQKMRLLQDVEKFIRSKHLVMLHLLLTARTNEMQRTLRLLLSLLFQNFEEFGKQYPSRRLILLFTANEMGMLIGHISTILDRLVDKMYTDVINYDKQSILLTDTTALIGEVYHKVNMLMTNSFDELICEI